MIYKPREIPFKLRMLQSLLRRIQKNHPKFAKIQEEYLRVLAGFKGEQAIDYPLSFLPSDQYAILHDLRLHVKPHYFQLDTLILHASFFLILEIKNISGTLLFDTQFHQLIRNQNESEEAFPDPILQTQRQERLLMNWLQKLKLPHIPIYSLVVSSTPRSIIKTTEPHSPLIKQVIRSGQLPLKIQELEQENTEISRQKKEMKFLVRSLIKAHTPKELFYTGKI